LVSSRGGFAFRFSFLSFVQCGFSASGSFDGGAAAASAASRASTESNQQRRVPNSRLSSIESISRTEPRDAIRPRASLARATVDAPRVDPARDLRPDARRAVDGGRRGGRLGTRAEKTIVDDERKVRI
jgi:hypothetical protein